MGKNDYRPTIDASTPLTELAFFRLPHVTIVKGVNGSALAQAAKLAGRGQVIWEVDPRSIVEHRVHFTKLDIHANPLHFQKKAGFAFLDQSDSGNRRVSDNGPLTWVMPTP